jgi:hypothetical protein
MLAWIETRALTLPASASEKITRKEHFSGFAASFNRRSSPAILPTPDKFTSIALLHQLNFIVAIFEAIHD